MLLVPDWVKIVIDHVHLRGALHVLEHVGIVPVGRGMYLDS